jgi:alkanesulfonate monooxygenase SsuD/methylene tetrahydromethanopterin reductase-like flavin-dependent oxidoreductase (luciferase family)
MYVLRFDLRGPGPAGTDRSGGGPEAVADLYAAAVDMAAWGEAHSCMMAVVSEHHAAEDGFLPSPLVLAGAMAARTTTLPLMVAAAVLPFYDPVRLAEDMVVLDLVSRGRVSYVLGLGYRPEEFELYGLDHRRRAALVEERLPVLLAALRDGRVATDGRSGPVTPAPYTEGGPPLAYGGSSSAAARRAARYGLDLFAQTDDPALADAYRAEAERLGREPGSVTLPSSKAPYALFVADDVDAAWDEIGPYLLRDATEYAAWNTGDATTASLSRAASLDELRRGGGSHRIVTVDEAVALATADGYLTLHPLCGGIPPELAWPYLLRVADMVLPALG